MTSGLPQFAELSQFRIEPASVQLLGYGYCRKKHVVVLGSVDPDAHDPVTVGMLNPTDAQLLSSLQAYLHRPIVPVRLNAWEIERAIEIGYDKLDPHADPGRLVLPLGGTPSYEPGHPAPALAQQLLAQAISLRARQIHIERYADDVDVRLRIDGALHQLASPLAPDNVGAVVGYLGVLAAIPEDATGPRSGVIRATLGDATGGRPFDLRLSLLPGPYGEDATLHVMHAHAQPRPLDALGLSPAQLHALSARLDAGQGLVVIGAAADHGRTTALYSVLSSLDATRRKILTVEPVMELDLPKIPQRTPSDGVTLAELVTASVEHAPDVLAVGDASQPATVDAIALALRRGVLVIAVVEAPDAAGALGVLRRLGLADEVVADHLVAVLSPRLLPRLCPTCRVVDPADPRAAALARTGRTVPGFTAPGCDACGGRGHVERVGAHELLLPTPELLERIAAGAPTPLLRQAAGTAISVIDHALGLAERGEVDLATVAALPGAAAWFSA